MKELYITSQDSKGFIREGSYCYPLNEVYITQGARLESSDKSLPISSKHNPTFIHDTKLVFIEQSFEPISRIKRGRFFLITDTPQPDNLYRYQGQGGILQVSGNANSNSVAAYKFQSYEPSREFDIRNTFVFFGNSRIQSKWKILAVDSIVTNEEVYVLQEVNGIGVIPTLDETAIPFQYFKEVESEYEILLSELHTSPESVVDHCRDVATSLLTALLDSTESRKDLGKLIGSVEKKYQVVINCAAIINRLHPRRKPNEKERHKLKDLTGADADFAVQCIFQIIKELNWSKK